MDKFTLALLLLLAVQNVTESSLLRLAAKQQALPGVATTFLCEICKFTFSFSLAIASNIGEAGQSAARGVRASMQLRYMVPAFLYAVQNMLKVYGQQNTPPYLYSSLSQSKIVFAALWAYVLLGQTFSKKRIGFLVQLSIAMVLLAMSMGQSMSLSVTVTRESFALLLTGAALTLIAACLSGLTGNVTQLLLQKGEATEGFSVWEGNMALSLWGAVVGGVQVLLSEVSLTEFVASAGPLAWAAVLTSSVGGLMVAVLLKHAGAVVKCFATCVAMQLSLVTSSFLGETPSISSIGASLLAASAMVGYATASTKSAVKPTPKSAVIAPAEQDAEATTTA